MSEQTSDKPPLHQVRRRDRVVEDDAWIRARLRELPYGVVASEAGGQAFTNPVLFVYNEETNSIYFHTGRVGRIFQNLTANPRLCFNTCHMGETMSDLDTCRFDVAYESVVVFGRATMLDDTDEAAHALRLLVERYAPALRHAQDAPMFPPQALARTAVWRITIESWSGKRNPG